MNARASTTWPTVAWSLSVSDSSTSCTDCVAFVSSGFVGSREDIAAGHYHSRIAPKSVLATLGAFEVRYLPVVFAAAPQEAAAVVERWAWYFAREIVENANDLLRGSQLDSALK